MTVVDARDRRSCMERRAISADAEIVLLFFRDRGRSSTTYWTQRDIGCHGLVLRRFLVAVPRSVPYLASQDSLAGRQLASKMHIFYYSYA